MKQKIVYVCEFCGKVFQEKETCEDCEAIHFGITRREYLDWRMLNREAGEAGKRCGICNDETKRANFARAVENLISFEERHGISPDCKKPTDFF